MAIIILIYILLLIGFFAASAFIFRHLVKYGYLSKKFRIVVIVFGILSAVTIAFSIYLISSTRSNINGSTPSYNNSSGLNF